MKSGSERKGLQSTVNTASVEAPKKDSPEQFLQAPPSQDIISQSWFLQHVSTVRRFQEISSIYFQSFPERGSEFACGITNEEIHFGLIGAGVTKLSDGNYRATVPVTLLGIAEILNALILIPNSLADPSTKLNSKKLEAILATALASITMDRCDSITKLRKLLNAFLVASDISEGPTESKDYPINFRDNWRLGEGGDFQAYVVKQKSWPISDSDLDALTPESDVEWSVYKHAPTFMLRFILLHEWMHAVLRHFPRRESALTGTHPHFTEESWSYCCELAADRFAFESLLYSHHLFLSGKFQLKRSWTQLAFWSVNLLFLLIDQQESPSDADTHPSATLRCRSLIDSFDDESISNPFGGIRYEMAIHAGKFQQEGWSSVNRN